MNPVEEEEDEELKSMAPPETTSQRSTNGNGCGPDKIEKVSSLTSIDTMGEVDRGRVLGGLSEKLHSGALPIRLRSVR